MSSDAVTYDAILPERATVPTLFQECGDEYTRPLPDMSRPARAGDTIEVACPECGGSGWVLGAWPGSFPSSDPCPRCSGTGTVLVWLTEDPAPVGLIMPEGHSRQWRHVGSVVTP